ncbi:MAG: hypothetical protein ACREMH_05345 [Gemmatimonadales bacterium]
MRARPMTDTSALAAAVQIRVLRGLPAVRRLELAVEMSLAARALQTARLRTRHPGWTEAQVAHETLRLTLPAAVLPPSLR